MVYQNSRILFFEQTDLERLTGGRFVMNPPVKRGAAFAVEEPWEIGDVRGSSIIRVGRLWRLYYRVQPETGGGPFWAFVESEDGVTWQRPDLGIIDYAGSKHNNLIDFDGQEPNETCFFVDPTGPEEHRIKAVCHRQHEGGMYLVTSPDGVRFRRAPGFLLNFIADNHLSAFYDERLRRYRIYLRGWDIRRPWLPIKGSRMLSLAETDDLFAPLPFDANAPDPWPLAPKFQTPTHEQYGLRKIHLELPPVIRPDDDDPPEAGIYQGAVVHYLPDRYLAFPTLYFRHPGPPEGFVNDGILDVQFAVSRDGVIWNRLDRLPYLRLDLPDGPGTKLLHMLTGLVPHGYRLRHYYAADRYSHGEGRRPGEQKPRTPTTPGEPVVCMAEQRLDGFVSIDLDYAGGTLITKPFTIAERRLKLNIDTSASGYARAALLGRDGKAIPGFEVAACDRIQGNDTGLEVSWNGSSDLSKLIDRLGERQVSLLLEGRATKLYAVLP